MKLKSRAIRFLAIGLTGLVILSIAAAGGLYLLLTSDLPTTESLREVHFQVPLRVLSSDGRLIAEFGEMKRTPVHFKELPERVIQAFLAAEDDRFFSHPGVDYQGLLRAAVNLVLTGERSQGGSTITMQVARNFFLSNERSFGRKAREIILALRIDHELTKEEILELYLNKIYLGNRAYGVGAAAQVYYGKTVDQLSLAEIAMIAGLPKAPSLYNPMVNPQRAESRRNYVLDRMFELGFIDEQAHAAARAQHVEQLLYAHPVEVEAPYLAEMVRTEMVSRFGEEQAYTTGMKVYTTVSGEDQLAANRALRNTLLDYDRRHGYRGAEAHVDLPAQAGSEAWDEALGNRAPVGGLIAGLVVGVDEKGVTVHMRGKPMVRIESEGLKWALGAVPSKATNPLRVGDIIRLQPDAKGWRLTQIPEVAGSLVALRPDDGAVLALVGGFDFFASKYNRVIQAQRQPGSSFKPFIYSAALEHGFTAATLVNDSPIVIEDAGLEGVWRPENSTKTFLGPLRLREALVRSRNLVSIRVLRTIGVDNAIEHASRFGFDPEKLPRNLSLALGSASLTPMEMVRGYAVFANGGFRVEPYFIQRVEDAAGAVLMEASPLRVCHECEVPPPSEEGGTTVEAAVTAPDEEATPLPVANPSDPVLVPVKGGHSGGASPRQAPRAVSAQNIYIMTSMMQDVIRRGTATRALSLNRSDIAGKTGTTNEQRDAWFSGFTPDVVATVWVGFDNPKPMGGDESGAHAALPMWIEFMASALRGIPEHLLPQPAGLVTARIDADTGGLAEPGAQNTVLEIFPAGKLPAPGAAGRSSSDGTGATEQLF